MANNEYDDWFDQAMRTPHAAAKFTNIGDAIVGEIIDMYKMGMTDFKTKQPIIDEKTGEQQQQLVIVVDTTPKLTNWALASPLKGADKQTPLGPEHDDGSRAIFFPKNKNQYWELGRAIQESGAAKPEIGGKIAIKLNELRPTEGDPQKRYVCRYKPPVHNAADGFFQQPPAAQAPPQAQQQPPAPQAAPAAPQAPAGDPWAAPSQPQQPWPPQQAQQAPPAQQAAPAQDGWQEPPF